ncbi:MAG: GNAT family N-acetyltransferase [Anaerolineae bacterium]|nr:GNAT family N-acetyltransferase [Anaerolineae bacterium]
MFTTQTYTLKNGKALVIRQAEPSDAQAVLNYLDTVVGETNFLTFGPGEFELTVAQEAEFFEKSLEADNQIVLLALVDDKIIGNLTFRGRARRRVRHQGEFGITILRAYWGLGIGTLLIENLIAWARAGVIIRKINLRVREDNHRAMALYKRLGFVMQGTITREFFIDGKFYSTHVMGLEINET